MAQRLSTNYANAFFAMSEEELNQFVSLFANDNFLVSVQERFTGDRDIFISDGQGEIKLTFSRIGPRFSCESSYEIRDLNLANTMRKAMKRFKGHGIVHRVYDSFTMVYHYDDGDVIRIQECADSKETLVFESTNHNQAKELEMLFQQNGVEHEIQCIRAETDRLLDLRIKSREKAPDRLSGIDRKLAELSRRLYTLEA
ncbi:hypothetical protein EDM56_05785 [Brevibacillus fluminis]|uniref:Non-ribosomal peptide synthetase module n=1 Tax=Brevibacillus fluminis TaxID=511487 RepID=A0A3M8DUE0_9BACL|nr:hypothetical protein [Brevibacillus fluminis]RNB91095.1 hypothetical protein EDM56_05785 [Brevibacillus fluminis]